MRGLAVWAVALFITLHFYLQDVAPKTPFSEDEAWKQLHQLNFSKLFSTEGEARMSKYILDHLENATIQKVSGEYFHDMRRSLLVYEDVTNILVKIPGKRKDIVMVSCHYDTGITKGIYDDGVPVVIMLQVYKLLKAYLNDRIPEQTILFHFNGAEEMALLGAHGFASKHPWAKDVKVFLNLEAAGYGGKAIAFQTTNAWAMEQFAASAVHPRGTVVAQDVFQSRVIPSDTDFRAYVDIGHMPHGIDLSYYRNGYYYHTPRDDLNQYEKGSVQHMGDNVYAFLVHMANYNETIPLSHPSKSAYFDFLGLFMVRWPSKLIFLPMHLFMVVSLAFIIVFGKVSWSTLRHAFYLKTACLVAIAVNFGITYVFISQGKMMTWYSSNPFFALLLYGSSTIAVLLVALTFYEKSIDTNQLKNNTWLFYLICLWAGTVFGVGSSYLAFTVCLCYMLSHFITTPLFKEMIGIMLPSILLFDVILLFVDMFIPLMGRFGNAIAGDYVICVLLSLLAILLALIALPFIVDDSKIPRVTLFTFVTIAMACWVFSYQQFAYSIKYPKRLSVQEVQEYIMNEQGSVNMTDHRIVAVGVDAYPITKLESFLNMQYEKIEVSRIPSVVTPDSKRPGALVKHLQVSGEETSVLPYTVPNVHIQQDGASVHFTIISDPKVFTMQLTLLSSRKLASWSMEHPVNITMDEINGEYKYNWFRLVGYQRKETSMPKIYNFSLTFAEYEKSYMELTLTSIFVNDKLYSSEFRQVFTSVPEWCVATPSFVSIVHVEYSTK